MNTPQRAQETAIEPKLPGRAEEARALATEGLEEMRSGNKEEAKFLIDEARNLDPQAAAEIIKAK